MAEVVGVEVLDAKIVGNTIDAILNDKSRWGGQPLSQEEASRRVGCSYRHFNRIILNRCEPSMLLSHRISIVLGEPYDKLWKIKVVTQRRRTRSAA